MNGATMLPRLLLLGTLACGHLPVEETYPAIGPSIAAGVALDGGLQLARAPWWMRLTLVPAAAATVRYSRCCRRGEGTGFGIVWGAGLSEVLGLFVRTSP